MEHGLLALPIDPPPFPLPLPPSRQAHNPSTHKPISPTLQQKQKPHTLRFKFSTSIHGRCKRTPVTSVAFQSRIQSRIQARIAPEHYLPQICCILPMGTLTGRRICFFTHMASYRHGARGMRYMIFSHSAQEKLVDVRQRGLSCHVALATAAAPRSCSSICVVGARRPLPLALPHA